MMNVRLVLGGLKSYLPVQFSGYKGTEGTVEGAYCYAVWLRHLVLISKYVPGFAPRRIVEIGPGDSIGLGLAALLTGVESYVGLDVLEHAAIDTNLRVLDELVALFRQRATVPDSNDYPFLVPELDRYAFPSDLIDASTLDERLSPAFVERLRTALRRNDNADPMVQYRYAWSASTLPRNSVDLVVGHGALQDMDHLPHRDDLRRNLEAMVSWLEPGGVMSQNIELSCPGGAEWNHHWAYGDFTWTLIRGKRPYYKNRVPLSEYLRLFDELGLEVKGVRPATRTGLPRNKVAPKFRNLPDEDFQTRGALVVAVKR